MGAAMGLGFILGPAIGGIMGSHMIYRSLLQAVCLY